MSPLNVRLASYLPRLLVRYGADVSEARSDSFRAAVLLTDISGFTALAERLAQKGSAGAEELTAVLNGYFGPLIDVVHAHGGDVAKFAGDALLVLWPCEGELQQSALLASACGLALQAEIARLKTLVGIPLDLKVAIGAGEVALAQLGGVLGRWEFVVMGEPFGALAAAAHCARAGDVLVAGGCWELVAEACVGTPAGEGATRLKTLREPVLLPGPDAAVTACRPDVSPSRAVRDFGAGGRLEGFLPGAVRERVAAGQEDWLSELRQVSVLFVNLPDLHHDMPLDFAQELIAALQGALYRFEGSLNKLSVDEKGVSLVAVLGLPPLSHADDAVRAVRAAVAMAAVLAARGVRGAIGVATGKAFCGEVGNAARREYTVMGDVVNLAARLMQAAGAGVLCDEATRARAREVVAFEALPAVSLKGKAEAVAVFRPAGEIVAAGRRRPLLVGRSAEKALLEARLQGLWNQGGAQVLVVEGEAGIGKSDLAAFALERCDRLGIRHLVAAADSLERATPFHAWRDAFATALEGVSVDGADPRAPLANAVFPGLYPETELTARLEGSSRSEQTADFLVGILRRWQAGQPLVLVVEDSHWLDSASWSLALAFARRLERLLLVLVTRPVDVPLPEVYTALRDRAEIVRLGALAPADAAALIRRKLPDAPAAVVEAISERAGGHPYFCEELAAALREASPGELPATIQGVLTSRIDRLPPAEQLALKVASVIGRVFSLRALAAVHPLQPGEAELASALDALAQADLTPKAAAGEYSFKHAIAQEVAYDLLLHAQRRAVHERVAAWYEAEPEAHYPLLAHHYDRAGAKPKALEYLVLAGEQALANWSPREAHQFLDRAAVLAEDLGDKRMLMRTQAALGSVFRNESRMQEAIEAHQAAFDLAEELGEREIAGAALVGLGKAVDRLGQSRKAIEYFRRAESCCRSSDLLRALSSKMRAHYRDGDALRAIEEANRAISLAASIGGRSFSASVESFLGWLYVSTDVPSLTREERVELGLKYLEEAVATQRDINDRFELGVSLGLLGNAYRETGNLPGAELAFRENLQYAEALGDEGEAICATINLADLAHMSGELDLAVELARTATIRSRRAGTIQYLIYAQCLEGVGLAKLGDVESAQAKILEALELAKTLPIEAREHIKRELAGSFVGNEEVFQSLAGARQD